MKKRGVILDTERDQHILRDAIILQKEIEVARLTKDDRVIEIGSGPGNLTKELAKRAGKVLAFEIDKRFKKETKKEKNVKVIYGNALAYSWKGYNKIVANIPYAFAEPILWKAIKEDIETLVLIVGKNFKDVLMNEVTKMGIVAQLFFVIEPIVFVPRLAFFPVPRTDSWLIKLTRKTQSERERIVSYMVCSTQKTKNAIITALTKAGMSKKQTKEWIEKMKISRKCLEDPARQMSKETITIIKKKLEKRETKVL